MSANSTYITILTVLTTNVPMIINFLTIILVTIGGAGNLITFTAARLRSNACVFYLLCASVLQIPSVLFAIPTRLALDNFGDDLERRSMIFCKLRYYLALTLPQLVTYYMLLAILDRCLTTSNNVTIRSWSQLKIARRNSFVLFIIIAAMNIHVLVFYEIRQNSCQISSGKNYTIFFTVYLSVIITLLPHFLMFIFALITMNNLKKTRRRVLPTSSTNNNSQVKRLESQLILVRTILSVPIIHSFFVLRFFSSK